MNIAIYSRKSVMTEKGDSIGNQIDLCKKYCENYIDKDKKYIIYEDEGFSGKNINRPKFKELINDIKHKKIDILICYRLDRISRNVSDFSSTLELLQKYEVTFISLKEQFDTSTPMGRAMIYIASVFAQLERETIGERVKDNMIQLAKMGKWSGGQLPLGFSSEKTKYFNEEFKQKTFVKLVPIKEELEIIEFIYDTYLLSNSIRNTTKTLKERGYKTKNNCTFELSQVKRILRNPLYVKSDKKTHEYLKKCNYKVYGDYNGNGYLTYNKKTNKENIIVAVANHKGIIPSDKWIEVQNRLDTNKDKVSSRIGTGENDTLFSGLLKCGKCGANMVIKYNNKNKDGKRFIYYVCNNKLKITGTCDCPNLRSDLVDEKILKVIKEYNKDVILNAYDKKIKELNSTDTLSFTKKLNEELEEKNTKVHNLISKLSLADNEIASSMIMDEINNISNEIAEIKMKIENEQSKKDIIKNSLDNIKYLKNAFINFDKSFNASISIESKRYLLRTIIESITYNVEENNFDINFFMPETMQNDNKRESMCYQKTYKVNLYDIGDSIGSKLKYYRKMNNLTQDELAAIVGYSSGTAIKHIEVSNKYPHRDVSIKLAKYFNLDTKYFFDNYYEETDNIANLLKEYRKENDMTIKDLADKLNVAANTVGQWELKNTYPSRKIYKKIIAIIT